MVIVWKGWGLLAPAIVVAALILVQLAADGLFGAETYSSSPAWPGLAFLLSAVVIWPLGHRLNNGSGQEFVDSATGQGVVLRPVHTFFFVRMEYWAVVLAGGAVIALLAGLFGS